MCSEPVILAWVLWVLVLSTEKAGPWSMTRKGFVISGSSSSCAGWKNWIIEWLNEGCTQGVSRNGSSAVASTSASIRLPLSGKTDEPPLNSCWRLNRADRDTVRGSWQPPKDFGCGRSFLNNPSSKRRCMQLCWFNDSVIHWQMSATLGKTPGAGPEVLRAWSFCTFLAPSILEKVVET